MDYPSLLNIAFPRLSVKPFTKVEVRKLLTKVNKQTGKNQAKEWIKNLGHDSLTEVEELDDLKALKALAEEELGA